MKIPFQLQVLFFFGIALLSSCTIQERIHFNEDFSGHYEIDVDLSMLMAMGGEEMSDSALLADFAELNSKMAESNKVKNFSMDSQSGVVKMSLDFNDPSFFELFYPDTGEQKIVQEPRFELKKGKLIIRFKEETYAMDGLGEDSGEDVAPTKEEEDSQDELLRQMTYRTVITFDRPIKKVKSDIATYEKGSREVIFDYDFSQASRSWKKWQTEIRFK